MGMLDELTQEMENAPSGGGDFWKPDPGTYKVVVGSPTFEEREFQREDGKTVKKRQCQVPTKIYDGETVKEELTWTFNVSKYENSVCHEFYNACTIALQEGAPEGAVPLIVEVKGVGLERKWSVYSVENYRAKMEAAKGVLG